MVKINADVGAAAEWTPWWGSDPRLPQGGIRLGVRGGVGDWSYRTVTAGAGTALPLPGALRLAAEVEGGTSWGAPPPQRGQSCSPVVSGGRSPVAWGIGSVLPTSSWLYHQYHPKNPPAAAISMPTTSRIIVLVFIVMRLCHPRPPEANAAGLLDRVRIADPE